MISLCHHRVFVAIYAVSVLVIVGLMGCGGSGGGSGSDSTPPENSSPLVVASVQFGRPVGLSSDDGEINGAVFPSDKAEAFMTVDSSDPTGKMGIWLKINVSGVQVMHYDWEIVDWQNKGPCGELSYYDEVLDVDSQLGIYKVRSTNDYLRYDCAINSAISSNHIELVKVTAWTDDGYFTTAYFSLRLVSNRRLFVVGDSISTRRAWPWHLASISSRHTFSQAIGGSHSPSMVLRARGVELAYPLEGVHSIEPGPIQLRWHRHIADRTQNESYRSIWADYAKAVSEPDAVEVYKGETFVGYAERVLKPFSTSNEVNQTRIYCDDHGLADGDRIAFISNDQEWPSDISVLDASATWNFSSGQLPINIVERRVYFATNIESNSFEIKEFESDEEPMCMDGDTIGSVLVECGWRYDFEYGGGVLDIGWRPRIKYDDLIWLLMVSANDIPGGRAAEVTIPNTEMLLDQMSGFNQRFILVCPPSGSYWSRGPGSVNWINYYDTYIPWVYTTYPDNHVDTMAVLGVLRSQAELNLLSDPEIPELLWISGSPSDESSWMASSDSFDGASQKWVGSGYIPLQFRASLSDGIHLNALGNQVLAEAVLAFLNEKGW